MKRMWSVLRVGLIIGATVTLVSCNVIQGELTLLVEERSAYSPCWASDGSKVYFVASEDALNPVALGQIWSVDIEDKTQKKVSEEEVKEIDISRDGDLCVTYLDEWILVLNTETWTQRDSIHLPEEATGDWRNKFSAPRFSYETNEVIYYHYHVYSKSSYLHKVNLVDSTDQLILTTEGASVVAPGPGDTLLAFGDTIYNLNSQERIPIDIPDDYIQSIDWNPAVPTELVVSTGPQDDIFLFDLETQKATRIDIRPTIKSGWVGSARFSPDGDKIVFGTLDAEGTWSLCKIWLFEPID